MREIRRGDIVLVDGYLRCRVVAVYENNAKRKFYDVIPIDRHSHKRIVTEASVKLSRPCDRERRYYD